MCEQVELPAVIVAPESASRQFSLPFSGPGAHGFLISLKQAVYEDCMNFVSRLVHLLPGTALSGGVHNIARRDFLGVPLVHAVFTMNKIPDHYFQAVGSGSGAIASFEAANRLSGNTGFRPGTMQLHLAQNIPFTPILDLWQTGSFNRRATPDQVLASVLTNPDPPFRIPGGIRDVLSASRGRVYGVTNADIIKAKTDFQKLEGCDIQYPAAACVAALVKAVHGNRVSSRDTILLHITGGGKNRLKMDKELYPVRPALTLDKNDVEAAARAVSDFLSSLGRKKTA